MGYTVEIIFGKEEVLKYQQGIPLSDYENLINKKKYEFDTLAERNAFYKGLGETVGWTEFEVIKEHYSKPTVEDETTFDYWDFIVKYYPGYDHCEDWDVRKVLMELDKELLGKAFENFFTTIYPDNTI